MAVYTDDVAVVATPTDGEQHPQPEAQQVPWRGLERFVHLASGSDSPRSLLEAARSVLGRMLAVVGADGAVIAASPPADGRFVAVAERLAEHPDKPPAGWEVRRLGDHGVVDAWLLAGPSEEHAPGADDLLEMLGALMSAQLRGAALRQTVLSERQAFLKQRLITDPAAGAEGLHAAARAAEFELAACYWPALIVPRRGELSAAVLTELSARWARHVGRRSFVVPLDGAAVAVCARDAPGPSGVGVVEDAVRALVAPAGAGSSHALCAVLADQAVPLEQLHAQVRLLRRLRNLTVPDAHDGAVLHVRNFALDRLLRSIDGPAAQGFVHQYLGRLIDDDAGGGDLAHTLELALKYPRRDDAARAAYMHRNTFRRRLQRALRLVDADLDDPDQRLALHLALKLHRLSRCDAGPSTGQWSTPRSSRLVRSRT